jgi:hypothetical protein
LRIDSVGFVDLPKHPAGSGERSLPLADGNRAAKVPKAYVSAPGRSLKNLPHSTSLKAGSESV